MGEKSISWSEHALTTARERSLEPEWVEETVRQPDWSVPDPEHSERERRYKAFPGQGSRILRVVVVETSAEIRIVTAFFDRKACRP